MDKLTFDLLRKRCNALIKKCYHDFKIQASSNLQQNPKYFWSFVKEQKSNSASIPNEMHYGVKVAKGGQQIANLFSECFQNVYQTGLHSKTLNTLRSSTTQFMTDAIPQFLITESEVLQALQELDCNKGPGPDLIPPIFLRSCADYLFKPLTKLFNISLRTGMFPMKWKLAHLTPIHKSGDTSAVDNYRPISILSISGKILESLVYRQILPYIYKQINPNQHGFLPCRSTSTNIVEYITDVSEALDKQGEVHAIYTDFRKAFDLVNHDILLEKLSRAGVHGSLLRWCESYLLNRSQLVAVRGFTSEASPVPSGVPQGSHLGPLFFLVFINDICENLHCKYKLFADDLKVYRTITSQHDSYMLQNDINHISLWCKCNSMFLNSEKCFFLRITRKKNISFAKRIVHNW